MSIEPDSSAEGPERPLGEHGDHLGPAVPPPIDHIGARRRNRAYRRAGTAVMVAAAGAAVLVAVQQNAGTSRDVSSNQPAPVAPAGPAAAATQFPSDEAGRECRDAAQTSGDADGPERLRDRDVPVAVTVCEAAWERLDGRGTWRVRKTVTLTGSDLTPVIDALTAPSTPRSDGSCPAIGYLRPAFSVTLDDGSVAHPPIPAVDACGRPSPAAVEQLQAALRRPDVRLDPLEQMQSENATETGCNEDSKIWSPDLAPALPNRPGPEARVAVCAYDANSAREHVLPLTATGWTTGRFVLDLVERIDLSARPAGCAEAGFEGSVELKVDDLDEPFSMYVETVGCHRVMGLESRLLGTLTARDAALVRRLADRPER